MPQNIAALLSIVLYGALAFVVVWLVLRLVRLLGLHDGRRLAITGLLLLGLLLIPTHALMGDLPAALEWLLYLLPIAALGLCAGLLAAGVRRMEQGSHGGLLFVLLSAALLLKVLHNLYGLLAWDQIYDPLGWLLLLLPVLVAFTAGAALLSRLEGAQKLLGLELLVLVPALLFAMQVDVQRIDRAARTEANARAVAREVEAFATRQGRYPAALEELSPLYRWAYPRPWIIYGLDWCYQGGADFYRLGYLDRVHWSSPELSIRVVQEAGSPPPDDLCAAQVAELQRRSPRFPYVLLDGGGNE